MNPVKDFQVNGKRVLLRVDINVPLKEDGTILDDFRLRKSIPTIQYIVEQQGKCIIIGHLGRPTSRSKKYSLQPIAKRLQELLGRTVVLLQDPIGESVKKDIAEMKPGEVVVLENIRFYKEEEDNDPQFAKKLADLGDLYVNDAFAVDHRAHASLVGIPKYLPSRMGLLLEKEIHALEKISTNPKKPFVVVVGGAKVETKASFLKAISKHADAILLGDLITKEVQEKGVDVSPNTELVYALNGVDGTFDLGPRTIQAFCEKIQLAKTICWAGPLGMIEEEKYEKGSLAIAYAIIESKAFAVVGGGDLVGFLGKHNLREKFSHVSTGGGAMLAFLSGEKLPGLEALEK